MCKVFKYVFSVCSPGSVCRMKIPVPAPALPPLHPQLSSSNRRQIPQRNEKAKPAWARPPNSSPLAPKGDCTPQFFIDGRMKQKSIGPYTWALDLAFDARLFIPEFRRSWLTLHWTRRQTAGKWTSVLQAVFMCASWVWKRSSLCWDKKYQLSETCLPHKAKCETLRSLCCVHRFFLRGVLLLNLMLTPIIEIFHYSVLNAGVWYLDCLFS